LVFGLEISPKCPVGFEIGAKPIDTGFVNTILSRQLNDLEPQLTRNGLAEQFDAQPAEIR
jgi:hypothetical protein